MKIRRNVQAVLLAAVIGVVSISYMITANADDQLTADIDTWIGYQLRNEEGKYLTVANGTAESGTSVSNSFADGVAPYNTWYFTETENGLYTLKSACGQGEYFLTITNNMMHLDLEQNNPSQFLNCTESGKNRIQLQQNNTTFGTYKLEPVTWLHMGDVNRDN